MANIYRTKLDIKSPPSRFTPTFVQHDHAILEIELLDEGKPYDLSNAARVEFTHVRKDGLVIIEPGVLLPNGNSFLISYEYQGSEMDMLGKLKASIAVFDHDDKKTSTHVFEITVTEDLRNEVFNPAEPNIGVLQKLLEEVQYVKDNPGPQGDPGPQGPPVPLANTLTSDSTTEAVTAAKAKELNEKINLFSEKVTTQLDQTEQHLFIKSTVTHRNKRPALTIIDDDGRPQVYTLLKSLMQRFNVPITSAVITGRIDVDTSIHISSVQMRELRDLGMEFVSHTNTHQYLATLTPERIDEELRTSQKWLVDNGFDGRATIVYPYGSQNATVHSIARKYYESAFDTDDGDGHAMTSFANQFNINRVNFNTQEGINRVAECKAKIDDAIANDAWVVLMSHCFYNGFDVDAMAEVIQYAINQGVEIITVREGLNRFGNTLDVPGARGNTVINGDGELSASLRNYISNVGITNLTPLSSFPEGISETHITNANSSGYPNNAGGTLVTLRNPDMLYNYQEYTIVQSVRRYRRYWDNTTSAWTAWEQVDLTRLKTLTALATLSDFELGITLSNLNTANANGLPSNKAGTLVTYKSSATNGYSYQIYKELNTHILYIRSTLSDSTWGAWDRLSPPVILDKTIGLAAQTIAAGASYEYTVTSNAFSQDGVILVSPIGGAGVESGIVYNCYITAEGTAKLRLTNVSSEPVNVSAKTWKFKVIK